MRKPRLVHRPSLIIFFLLTPLTISPQCLRGASEPYEVILSKDVMVKMRDGVRLATDLYFPAHNGKQAPGKFPAIMVRTPYPKEGQEPWLRILAAQGYVGIAQVVRGRYASEGHWRMLRDDGNDGYDTAQWLGQQPWFDGNLGTYGGSYEGGTQHALAISGAPYLKAMAPAYALSNVGRYGIRHNGAFELRWLNWILGAASDSHYPTARAAIGNVEKAVRQYAKGLPLRPGTTPLSLAPDYESWLVEAMSHGDNDEFWKNMGAGVVDHLAEHKDVPMYHISGWYDSWGTQVANLNYVGLSKTKKSLQRLIMGPWTHGGAPFTFAGEAEFGPEATVSNAASQLRWFDHWLKGVDNGVDREPPVRIFVMGGGDAHKTPKGKVFVGGKWRDEKEWPLARTVYTPFYLHVDGSLSNEKPQDAPPTSYLFDPRRPVPTLGGNISAAGSLMFEGVADQRCRADFWLCEDTMPLSTRKDVLVFQTPPLDRDVEVTGPLVVKLWASSNAPDTDFTAKLVDVYPPNGDFPDGVALNIGDSIVRTRYRDSLESAALMKPNEVYSFTIEMYPTSLIFQKGHRIRLDISSSNFPRFDVNPNTGEPLNDNRRWMIAENSIYHDKEHPSHILLPIIPN